MATESNRLSPELANWLKARQSALKIVKTTTTPSGQTIDWVPVESQHPSGKIATPPPAALAHPNLDEALRVPEAVPHASIAVPGRATGVTGGLRIPIEAIEKRTVHAVTFELDDPKIERGPAGTVPILRPNLSHIASTVRLQDLHRKLGGLKVNRTRSKSGPADPDPAGYFHNTDSQSGKFYGWDGRFNVWDPAINIPSGGNGTDHSILQVWLQNYSKPQLQSLEGGWTVDQSLNGDNQPHVFTYYTTNGYTADGDNLGGYNTEHKGFVQYSSSVFPGIRINGTSAFNGTQFEISMKFQLYQEPNSNEVNWWVAVQGIWMGYYPASLYNGGLGIEVDWIGSGGEIFSSLSNPELTSDQMGSGWKADGGWTKAAFLRLLRTQSDMAGTMANNNGTGTSDAATSGGADPYTIQMDMNSGSSWGSYFYVGGPTEAPKPAETFNQVTFNIVTGGDDLRGDSSATATVALPGGAQTFTLKAQNDSGWGNNSDHVKSFNLPTAQPLSAFGDIDIRLTSHNGFLETDDNWNIQAVTVTLNSPQGSTTLLAKSGNPLARLTGSSPSVTLHP
jgi:hypothetical protein